MTQMASPARWSKGLLARYISLYAISHATWSLTSLRFRHSFPKSRDDTDCLRVRTLHVDVMFLYTEAALLHMDGMIPAQMTSIIYGDLASTKAAVTNSGVDLTFFVIIAGFL